VTSRNIMADHIVVLDVGGVLFRAKKSTLASQEGYFTKLISSEWSEGSEGGEDEPIFIDRDPQCFPSILSFLRSGKIYLTEDVSSVYLQQLLDESEYYMLDGLIECIKVELKRREKKLQDDEEKEEADTSSETAEIFKSVAPEDVDDFFKRGYAYVGSYELLESAYCTSNTANAPNKSVFRNDSCSACGAVMNYDKWCKHVRAVKPVRVVVKRAKKDEDRYSSGAFGIMPGAAADMQGAITFQRAVHSVGIQELLDARNYSAVASGTSRTMPASPVPNRSSSSSSSRPPLTPGSFNLDQSF
jgi:hypothetical protein